MVTQSNFHRLCDQMMQEHTEICERMTTLYRALAERHETSARLTQLLTSLREMVIAHFEDEEGAGLFQKMSQTAPHWAHRVEHLAAEHGEMRERLNRLLDLVGHHELTPEVWSALEHGFREFSNQWVQHESSENELVQRVYDDDLGAHD